MSLDRRNSELRSLCPSGKRRFRSSDAAQKALDAAKVWNSQGASERQEQRIYECSKCDRGWHLTSQPTYLPKQQKPLRARSVKVETVYRTVRRDLVADMLADGQLCVRCVSAQATEVHELLSRARLGRIDDPENCVPLCHDCHSWITTHPADAEATGWSLPSKPGT